MSLQSNETFSQSIQNMDIHDSIDQLIGDIQDSGQQLQTKELLLEQMKAVLSQISILNKLRDGIVVMSFNHELSIRPNECHKYALLISIDENNLVDINIKPDYWRLNLQIKSSESDDDNQSYSLIQCESIELDKFLSSQTIPIVLELSEFQYKCLPLVIDVSLVFEIPQNLIKYIFESDLSEIENLYDFQLTQWTLNDFHFLSFVRYVDQRYDYKELMFKEMKSLDLLGEDVESSNESEAKIYTNRIFLMIETIKKTINIESDDKICFELIKHLVPKQIAADCIDVCDRSATLKAFYFGHNIKIIVSIFPEQPMFLNITIEANSLTVMATIRKTLIQLLNVSFKYPLISFVFNKWSYI